MSMYPQFATLDRRQELNKISYGLSAELKVFLRSKGYKPEKTGETLELVEVGHRYVKVSLPGCKVRRYNFMSSREYENLHPKDKERYQSQCFSYLGEEFE